MTGAGLAVLGFATAPFLVGLLDADPSLEPDAITYLRIVRVALPFAAGIATLQAAFAGVGATQVSLYAALVVNAVDIPLGIILIFSFNLGTGPIRIHRLRQARHGRSHTGRHKEADSSSSGRSQPGHPSL